MCFKRWQRNTGYIAAFGRLFFLFFILFGCRPAFAATYDLARPDQKVVGHLQFYTLKGHEQFGEIAKRFDVGFNELIVANPRVDPSNLIQGHVLLIPTQHILPDAPHQGIVVNIPEKRLYFFPKDKQSVYTFPVGVGKEGWDTPQGSFFIMQKKEKPSWIVPVSVRRDYDKNGVTLPFVLRSGQNNPLGYYLLRLSLPTYLIHGTNKSFGIGQRSTAGCMSMYPKDIKIMFSLAHEKERVLIVDQPLKFAYDQGFWIEVSDFTVDDRLAWPGSELYGNQALRDRKAPYDKPFELAAQVAKKAGVSALRWPLFVEALRHNDSVPLLIG
jgi:lipoprotein-anchoring transpeptidase ErfK/SrfK